MKMSLGETLGGILTAIAYGLIAILVIAVVFASVCSIYYLLGMGVCWAIGKLYQPICSGFEGNVAMGVILFILSLIFGKSGN